MRILNLFLYFTLFSNTVLAQSNPLDQKIAKASTLMAEDKLEEAETLVENVLDKNPEYGHGWDVLAGIRYKQYLQSKDTKLNLGKMVVTTKDEHGKEVPAKDDTLAQKLANMLNSMSPSKLAWSKFMFTARKGTLLSDESYNCSVLLRLLNIDPEVDSNISRKAIKYYNQGEAEFEAKNYNTAANNYKHAIEEEPNFYKASLYLGDVYYATGDYANAITAFKEAVRKFPDLMEPHKYLSDSYGKMELYDLMVQEALKTLVIYPDYSMIAKISDALYMKDKKLDVVWMRRGAFPNKVPEKHEDLNLNEYSEKKPMEVNGPWLSYQKAGEKMIPFCNEKGIINSSKVQTAQRYLEVYSWEEMLKAHPTDPSLEAARKAQKAGVLDCYVMITQFHYDIYPQYKDFILRNQDRVLKYYNDRIVMK